MGNVDTAGSTGTRPRFDWMGADREVRELAGGDAGRPSPPSVPDFGMSSEELYSYQRGFTHYAANRLMGVGHDQYSESDHQKFEDMSVYALVAGLREELADVVNYATMLDILVTRLVAKVQVNA